MPCSKRLRVSGLVKTSPESSALLYFPYRAYFCSAKSCPSLKHRKTLVSPYRTGPQTFLPGKQSRILSIAHPTPCHIPHLFEKTNDTGSSKTLERVSSNPGSVRVSGWSIKISPSPRLLARSCPSKHTDTTDAPPRLPRATHVLLAIRPAQRQGGDEGCMG